MWFADMLCGMKWDDYASMRTCAETLAMKAWSHAQLPPLCHRVINPQAISFNTVVLPGQHALMPMLSKT